MKEKRFYLIYKITNNLNQKFYIGKHETDSLDDDYFGSGKFLRNAQNKYGLENFTKTILFYCSNREEMNLLEHCIVTPEFCQREDVYNINEGGDGGWHHVNKNNLGNKLTLQQKILGGKNGALTLSQKLKNDTEFANQFSTTVSNGLKRFYINHPDAQAGKNNPMYKHSYSKETLQKMSKSHLGKKNCMSNKMWICNDLTHESKAILKTDPIPNSWRKGRFCK